MKENIRFTPNNLFSLEFNSFLMRFIFNYLSRILWRNKRRTIMILVGIVISTSLITGINIASDSLGTKMFEEEFDTILCDFEISSDKDIDGNFTKIKEKISPITNNYSEVEEIYASTIHDFGSSCYNKSGGSINWTFYEENNYKSSLFEETYLFGIDQNILNLEILEDIISFYPANDFQISTDLNKREIYINSKMAYELEIEIDDNITMGHFYREYDFSQTPISWKNATYSAENLTVVGFFNVSEHTLFESLFSTQQYIRDDEYYVLTSAEMGHLIYTELVNTTANLYYLDEIWMIGVIMDHSEYDFLNPQKIESFFQRFERDIEYSDFYYSFSVFNRGQFILESVNEIIMEYKLLIFAVSLPVIIMGGYLIRTNYFIVLHGRRREIGLLKCRSASNKEVKAVFYLEAIFLGISGGLLGILVGFLSAGSILSIFPQYNNISLLSIYSSLNISNVTSYLLGIGIGTVLSVFSSLTPIRNFSKLSTTEALQKYNIGTQTRTKFSKIDWGLLLLSVFTIIFSIWFKQSYIANLPNTLQIFFTILMPVIMALMPIVPFIFTYVVVKLICNISLPFFSNLVSKFVSIFNKKTDFFVSRSIIRNRARSTRLIFIIAMGLSFLIISDSLTKSQTLFEEQMYRIYNGEDSKFRVGAHYYQDTNLTNNGIWHYAEYIKNQESLNVSEITILETGGQITLYGEEEGNSYISYSNSYISNYYQMLFLDPINYTSNIKNLDEYIKGGSAVDVFNKLQTIENATLVSNTFLEEKSYMIGDSLYIEYSNKTNQELVVQHLEIVGSYSVLPGVPTRSREWDPFVFICSKEQDITEDIEIYYYYWLVEYFREDESSEDLNPEEIIALNNKLQTVLTNYDTTIYCYSQYSHGTYLNSYVISLINFLDIEKIYLLSLVTIGVGVIMYISIEEKSLDFGLLRARGIDKKLIFKTQVSEGAVFLSLGALISLVSLISAYALNNAIGQIIFETISIPRAFNAPILLLLGELALAIVIFIAAIYFATYIVSKKSDITRISELFRIT
ncbi:MAG: FtsX-like permease family protein [Candidatus Lokiarchaeota archaeon]|nr:FtsX-like permease family protein [Candidatus Lokiarchaeota archaeon]